MHPRAHGAPALLLVACSAAIAGPLAPNATPARPGAATTAGPAARAGAATALLRTAWQTPLDATVARIACADLLGEGKERLVTLAAAGNGGGSLSVLRWSGKAFVAEWTAPDGSGPLLMAAGRFAGGTASAQIVTPSGCWRRSGDGYAFLPAVKGLVPVGTLRLRDGSDRCVVREGSDYVICSVDPAAPGGEWLVREVAGAAPPAALFGVLHATPGELAAGVPADCAASGLLGFWEIDPPAPAPRILVRRPARGARGGQIVLARGVSPRGSAELWHSAELAGAVGDLAFGDPRGEGRTGLLVLSAGNVGGKGRLLSRMALN